MLLLIFIALTTFLIFHQFWLRLRNLPNGPLPLPILGNFHQFMFKEKWEEQFLAWKEKYGPVYTMWLGICPIITINDYETAVKLFINDGDTFADRPNQDHFFKLVRGGTYGVVQTSGHFWQEQRRASLKILRDFGLGKNQMQDRILDEFQTISESLNGEIKTGIVEHDVNRLIDIGVGSVINSLICGYRFTTNNKSNEFEHLKHYSNDFVLKFTDPLTNVGINSALLAKLPFIKRRLIDYKSTHDQLFNFVDAAIEDHLKQNDYEAENIEPLDFIDAYMIEMHKARKNGQQHYYSSEQCRNIILDLWLAGQETTSNTLQWAMTYLINYPEVQQKLHEELDRVVGGDRLVTVKDRTSLTYLNATILEIQRCANLAVLNIPHALARDIELNGHRVKKGTMITPQVSVIMSDPKNFYKPKEFNPSRFLDSDGNLTNTEKILPFSLGKRICLGESLAKMELFLFLANLLNQYKFIAGSTQPSLKRHMSGGLSTVIPFKCRVVQRFN